MKSARGKSVGSNRMSRSAIRFVAPVLVSLSVMLVAAVISIELLSTIRAYVGGEGLYSKGQKNATYYLAQYSVSHSEEDFQKYLTAIAFPLGDLKARLALQRNPVDLQDAREGFLAGGNDSADINSIILLFRLFGNVGPVHRAIVIWTEGDTYTLRICALAARMHQASQWASSAEQTAIRSELNLINSELTPLAARFSSTLGELARMTRSLLVLSLTLGTIVTGLLCIRVTHARVSERDVKERGLARMTELYAALSRTSQLILRVSDRDHFFDELCRICVGTSGLSLAAVGLLERDSSRIEFIASHGVHELHLLTLATAVASSTSGQFEPAHLALRDGRAQVFNSVQVPGSMFRASASFPLRCHTEIVGVLCVFSQEEHFFQKDIIDLMEQLAMEASFALESLQREADRRYQAMILADQNRILNLVASGADLRVIFTTLAQFMEAQSDGGLCTLAALEQMGSHYSLVVAPSFPEEFAPAVVDASHEEGSSPCTEAIRDRSPVTIKDLDSYPLNAPLRDVVRHAGLHSVNAWPILGSKGQVLGALSLYSPRCDNPHRLNAQLVGICTDLAGIAIESRWAADRIRHLAHHDDLTGLPNRLLFNHHLPRALARAKRTGGAVGVLFLDLDRFKVINDTLGHGAGDDVLCQVSKHLLQSSRTTDTLARVGGDEFTLLVEQFHEPQDLGDIAQKLLAATARTLMINGQEYHLSGSIGIAIYPKDGGDSASLLKNADIAMYRAKTSGRNNYQFYSNDIDAHSVERLSLENQLRHAVERREFEVHYQPKISIKTGRIAGAEALVRWRHPQRGMLLPSEFIFVAEEVGLIGSIGRLVLDAVCADAKRWRDQGLTPIRVAINLSAQQFADSRLLKDLDSVLRDTGCDPHSLEFEITESVVMTSPDKALLLLEQIKEHGITIAIDDFGTGHSSLSYLKRFPVDSVKIDYTFIRDIAADPDDLAITKAIIALGHSMGLKVVAEGVESATQLEILRRIRCDEFQGFLFSGAVPSAEFEHVLMVDAQGDTRVRKDGSVLATY